jgi:hypothetical protein
LVHHQLEAEALHEGLPDANVDVEEVERGVEISPNARLSSVVVPLDVEVGEVGGEHREEVVVPVVDYNQFETMGHYLSLIYAAILCGRSRSICFILIPSGSFYVLIICSIRIRDSLLRVHLLLLATYLRLRESFPFPLCGQHSWCKSDFLFF